MQEWVAMPLHRRNNLGMIKSKEQVIEAIWTHMQKRGGEYGDWFVGIGAKPRDCLFQEHHVRRNGAHWILRRTDSSRTAHDVLDYFVNILATDYGDGTGDGAAGAVYAYRKSDHTRP
jgi:hypothetical protein